MVYYLLTFHFISLNFLICVFSLVRLSESKECITSKIGSPCNQDDDCFVLGEHHLFCNKTHNVNLCSFHHETYIGQVELNKDCHGPEFSAEPWSNPVDVDYMDGADGIDCMRLCLHTETCFGITVVDNMCFLKNDECFANLTTVKEAIVGVLNVVREDYHCGCHYPFTRKRSSGDYLVWDPDCPESQLKNNPYRCCSEKGLCVKCPSEDESI